MSLDFELSKIKDWQQVCFNQLPEGKRELKPSTRDLIFSTMSVGIGELSEKTLDEFHFRQMVWNKLHDFEPFTYQQLKDHIGLRTNVAMESRARWYKRILDGYAQDLKYRTRREEQQAAEQPALAP